MIETTTWWLYFPKIWVHPRSLTASLPLKNDRWKITFLLGWSIFRGYIKLREGMIWAFFGWFFKMYTFVIQVASTFGMQFLISLSVGFFKRRIILLMFLGRYSLYQEYYVLLQTYVQTYVFLHYEQKIGFLIIVWNSFNCMKCSWVFYVSDDLLNSKGNNKIVKYHIQNCQTK